jgi:hypothetical protein
MLSVEKLFSLLKNCLMCKIHLSENFWKIFFNIHSLIKLTINDFLMDCNQGTNCFPKGCSDQSAGSRSSPAWWGFPTAMFRQHPERNSPVGLTETSTLTKRTMPPRCDRDACPLLCFVSFSSWNVGTRCSSSACYLQMLPFNLWAALLSFRNCLFILKGSGCLWRSCWGL